MRLKVLFFARAREVMGAASQELEVPDQCTGRQLFAAIVAQQPSMEGVLASCVLAVNQDYAELDNCLLKPSDEVAIIPPLSGG